METEADGQGVRAEVRLPSAWGVDSNRLRELYEKSGGAGFGLSCDEFVDGMIGAARNALPVNATASEAIAFFKSLHLRDLALAQACSRGSSAAWEHFVRRYQSRLYGAALLISRNESIASELAYSLSGDLFGGTPEAAENCRSKLASYTGRGSLEGWLKAILARAYVDRYRSERRVVSFDQSFSSLKTVCVGAEILADEIADPRISDAVKKACVQRNPEERFLLVCYFFDEWSLAEIAAALKVHESTISRRIKRLIRELRKSVTRQLRDTGLSQRQIEESFQIDVRRFSLDLRAQLLQDVRLVRE